MRGRAHVETVDGMTATTTVLDHVARGLTNSEIAQTLVISLFTVRNHVSSILIKLGLSNRTQAAARLLGEDRLS
jgi:DNA-binding NarL/FixJ family response regulator